ncbi:MAG: VOC family protein [Candidatus Cohnella colombiensis]|uniref:VOC family protein n=1 Tax=Candidatus Cohnella colombiensis TaxID=3121368 RepID=A0AA95JD92_9BACL|nr:MAG: VOC family protein [Cohnella sp.]
MNNNVIGIGHVAYTTGQMDAMLHFYCEILGFENSFALHDEAGKPWIQYIRVAGCQFIELFYAKEGFDPKEGTYAHLCIQVADVMVMSEHLKAAGIDVYWGPVQGLDHNWQCWAKDPDGNPIEFMQIDLKSPQAKAAGLSS